MPFVGVDPERTDALRRAGIRHVVNDFDDCEAFLRALHDAAAP
jgi:hypothetical protein